VPDELRAQLKVLAAAGAWTWPRSTCWTQRTDGLPPGHGRCQWLRLERAAGVSTVTDAVAGLLEKNFHSAAEPAIQLVVGARVYRRGW